MYSSEIVEKSPWDKLNIARDKNRPNARFYIENIFNDKSGWFIPSLEVIAARNPDIIFTSTYQVDDPVKEIIDRGNWNIIKAVREGKIYPISKEAVRPSIKIIEVIKKIAEISYPEYYNEIEKIAVD